MNNFCNCNTTRPNLLVKARPRAVNAANGALSMIDSVGQVANAQNCPWYKEWFRNYDPNCHNKLRTGYLISRDRLSSAPRWCIVLCEGLDVDCCCSRKQPPHPWEQGLTATPAPSHPWPGCPWRLADLAGQLTPSPQTPSPGPSQWIGGLSTARRLTCTTSELHRLSTIAYYIYSNKFDCCVKKKKKRLTVGAQGEL